MPLAALPCPLCHCNQARLPPSQSLPCPRAAHHCPARVYIHVGYLGIPLPDAQPFTTCPTSLAHLYLPTFLQWSSPWCLRRATRLQCVYRGWQHLPLEANVARSPLAPQHLMPRFSPVSIAARKIAIRAGSPCCDSSGGGGNGSGGSGSGSGGSWGSPTRQCP